LIDLTDRLKSARYRDDREHDDSLTLPSRSDLMKYRNRTIPDSGKALRDWVHTFSRHVDQDPQRFGLTADDAALIMAEANNYLQAAILAERPGTRTKITVRRRNDARKQMLSVIRPYVALIKANPEVESWDKVGLGLAMPNRRKSPTPVPCETPALQVRGGTALEHRVDFFDLAHDGRRGKPNSVTHVLIFRAIGERGTTNPNDAQYLGAFTRSRIRVKYLPKDAGRTVTYFGAWLMASGKQSAWSLPVSLMVAGAGPVECVEPQRLAA
jgi:hypothetical protein